MNFTNAEPRPKSSSVKEDANTLKITHTPNSSTVRCRRMYGVSKNVAMKVKNLPRKLNSVLIASFFEKSPRKVIDSPPEPGSELLLMTLDGEFGDSSTRLKLGKSRGIFELSVPEVLLISDEKVVANGPVIVLVENGADWSAPAFGFGIRQPAIQRIRGKTQQTIHCVESPQ